MELLYLFSFIAGLSHSGVSGRAVNISSTWFLPQEGFPVFYRYFNDKVTWNEAEAVCGFHHADLLSVQTSSEMDVVRAYLKEIDVSDNIWIGLQKESADKSFSWTNGEKLLGEGYWKEPIPKTDEKLCVAIDPLADFRWNSFYCRGPQVASFVCIHPVPEWAKSENGCLITSLPSLTVTLIPEVGVIQLLSDCGIDGTRRIACNSQTNRKEIIKRLSCDVDAFASTVFSRSTTANAVREIDTQQSSWSDGSNQTNRHETTKTYSRFTRHRRSPDLKVGSTVNVPIQEVTSSTPKIGKLSLVTSLNFSAHAFPHSPYSASVRNAPSTRKPEILKAKQRKVTRENTTTAQPGSAGTSSITVSPPNGTVPLYKDVPVLIITGEKLNESVSSATSENPQIVLMIENKDLNEPLLIPLSDDILVNNPSLSPVEIINVDLVEVENVSTNNTASRTTPADPPEVPAVVHQLKTVHETRNLSQVPTTPKPESEDPGEETLNAVEGDGKEVDIPQRANRGRLLTHPNHPSFYPHFLNRVLG